MAIHLWFSFLFALSAPVDALLNRLKAAPPRAMAGTFTQDSRVKLFAKTLHSTGRFSFAPPDRLHWEYLTPDKSVLEVDSHKATLVGGGQKQEFALDSDPTMRAIFGQLVSWMSGRIEPSADWDLAAGGDDTKPRLIVTPRATATAAKAFKRIELQFGGSPLQLNEIFLVEKSGDEKRLHFTYAH